MPRKKEEVNILKDEVGVAISEAGAVAQGQKRPNRKTNFKIRDKDESKADNELEEINTLAHNVVSHVNRLAHSAIAPVLQSEIMSEAMRAQIVEKELTLFLRGNTAAQITKILNKDYNAALTYEDVYKDLSAIVRRWREMNVDNMDVVIAREMDRLDRIEEAYWDAWTRSQQPIQERIITNITSQLNGEQQIVKTRETLRTGDIEFLKGVERVTALRMRLLGISSTSTVNVNWRTEAVKQGVDPDALIEAVVKQIIEAEPEEVSEN